VYEGRFIDYNHYEHNCTSNVGANKQIPCYLSSSDRKSSLSKCRSMASCKKCPNVQLSPYPPPRLLELKELGKKLSTGKRQIA
jgi:hypothetical protein